MDIRQPAFVFIWRKLNNVRIKETIKSILKVYYLIYFLK